MSLTEPMAGEQARESAPPVDGSPRLEAGSHPELSRHVRMTFDPVRDQHVLLGPETVVLLNPTGAAILERCDGSRTVTEIVDELAGQYNNVAANDVQDYLENLIGKKHVVVRHG